MLEGTPLTRAPSAEALRRLGESLLRPTALIEAAVFVGCLAAAWVVARLLRGHEPRTGSVWFDERVFRGALFPVLALAFSLLARWLLRDQLPIAVFQVVVPILFSLVVIRLSVRVLRSAFPEAPAMRALERSLSWLAWAAVALWIAGVLPRLLQDLEGLSWKIGATEVNLRSLIEGGVTAIVVLMSSLWISSALEARLLAGARRNDSIRRMAANALRAALLFIGVLIAAQAAGINLTALGVLGGALGVGIGFGLQRLAANYVSGFVILAERSMRLGDMVKVDGFEGRITDIKTRYTVIRALNGREAIVPNEMLITQRIENLSLADPLVLLSSVVQVAYGTDLEALFPRLVACASAVPRVLADPTPTVLLSAFASDGLELTINFWIADAERGTGNVRSDLNLAVLRLLNASAIEIPFPQRVLRRG